MSMMFIEDEEERARLEHESKMYHRIMRDGQLDKNGYLVSPPSDMTDEEMNFYKRLLKERNGKIQYVV